MDNGESVKFPKQRYLNFPDEVNRTREFLASGEFNSDMPPHLFLKPKLVGLQEGKDFSLVRKLAEELAIETNRGNQLQLFYEFSSYLVSDETAERVFANHLVKTLLDPLGLDLSVTKSWVGLSNLAELVDDSYLKQAKAIQEFMPNVLNLESQRPGAVKYFVDNFGLRSFGFQPIDTIYIKKQYDMLIQRESLEKETEENKWMRLINESLGKLGVSEQQIEQLFDTWRNCSRDDIPFLSVARNYEALSKLYDKSQDKAIIKTLIKEFGIHNFYRYTTQMLIDQYQHRDDLGDFGLLVYPKSDWNEAFNQTPRVLSDLASDSTHLGTTLKIVEAGGVSELVRLVGRMVKKSQGKIKYLVLGGHGTINDIRLGGDPHIHRKARPREVITIKDVLKPETSLFRKWLVEEPSVALVACSTGEEKGIAEILSAQFNAQIIAPDRPTNVNSIRLLQTNQGNLNLWVDYSKSRAVEYNAGRLETQVMKARINTG